MQIFVAQCWRVIGADAAYADGMPTFLQHFDELLLVLRQNPNEDRELLGLDVMGVGPRVQTAPSTERKFEHDRSLKHPRNGQPELFELHPKRVAA